VFENRVLWRIFGPKEDEVTGEWRILHNEQLNDLYLLTHYCADDKIEKNEIGGACIVYGWVKDVYMVLWGNLWERDHWGDISVYGKIILNGSSGNGMWGYGLD
jgi:hypothetical protein